ncbi:zinc-binding dehydrogenase [Streptomyces sp. S1]|uniref:zinc-binding dehydrogenase n=1 Tax=Streptomyces sp. S1 TaxID=718288 RepID=UPI003D74F301
MACALPTALLTEFGALTAAGFRSGQSVLSTGASTGIGMIGVQVARILGASKIIATTRAMLAATDGEGVDAVLDHVTGDTFAVCLPVTAVDGQVVDIGRLAGAVYSERSSLRRSDQGWG